MSTAAPRTSMPWAVSASRSAVTKNSVGLSTETARAMGSLASGIEPRSSSRSLPGERRAANDGTAPAAPVVSDCRDRGGCRPEQASRSPALRWPRPARSSPERCSRCTAAPLTPAASRPGRSSHAHPGPSASSSNALSSPMMRPVIVRTPSDFSVSAQPAKMPAATPSPSTMLGSPEPTTSRSPLRTPASIGPAATETRVVDVVPPEPLRRRRERHDLHRRARHQQLARVERVQRVVVLGGFHEDSPVAARQRRSRQDRLDIVLKSGNAAGGGTSWATAGPRRGVTRRRGKERTRRGRSALRFGQNRNALGGGRICHQVATSRRTSSAFIMSSKSARRDL